jgi:hypothetical protein
MHMFLGAQRVRALRVSTSDESFLEHWVSSSDHDNCKFTSYDLNPTAFLQSPVAISNLKEFSRIGTGPRI